MHVHIEGRIVLSGCFIYNDKNELLLLHRSDHNHYETPGGKVRLAECKNPDNPTTEELIKVAERELYEEIDNDVKIAKLEYFGKVEFTIPDGRLVIANKFLTKIISGKPRINEPDKFSKLKYLPIASLEDYPISPDLKLFVPKLKEHFGK